MTQPTHHASAAALGRALRDRPGPVAVIFADSDLGLAQTAAYNLRLGFAAVAVFCPVGEAPDLPDAPRIARVDWEPSREGALPEALNALVQALPERWIYWSYPGEYLFYPFCGTRPVTALVDFHASERRDAMPTTVIDLYPPTPAEAVGAFGAPACLDARGYFGLQPKDPASGAARERETAIFGGLRRRFEEHVPEAARDLRRIGLFRSIPGLEIDGDLRFNVPEMNTDHCPWHRNVTAATVSWRAAHALASNPASRATASRFTWPGSQSFDWRPECLMSLGLMEPGQWF